MHGEKMFDYGVSKQIVKGFFLQTLWRLLQTWFRRIPVVRWGSLRRLTPVSRVFGLDRGQPIDRYYIETFLLHNSADIQGHILEIGDPSYTRMFGGDKVAKSDVLHVTPDNPQATLLGNLATGEGIPSGRFDCMILTQTLPFIHDVHAAVSNCYTALKPRGVLLSTFPGISQISRYDMERWGDYWRFTTLSAKRLFEEVFPTENVEVKAYGNVLVAVAFLHGLAVEELKQKELDYHDPDYEVLITVRAVKPGTGEKK
jgi:hypothetical protein